MMEKFEDWKKKEIENIKNDILYHNEKLVKLKMKLKVYEV